MKYRILVVSVNDRCYTSYRYFAKQLASALREKGCDVGFCYMDREACVKEEAWDRAIVQAQAYKADAVIDFNSFLPKLTADGHALPELFHAPFYHYILDHPLYHHKALMADFPNSRCICVAEEHEVYIKEYYPRIESVFTSTLPGSIGNHRDQSFEERKNRILFCGTYESPELYEKYMEELPQKQMKLCKQMTESMMENPKLSLSDAGGSLLSDKGPEQLQLYFLVDAYVRNMRRRQIILQMIREELPLDIYGNGWEKLTEEIDRMRGMGKAEINDAVCFYPGIAYDDYVNLVGTYRYALNVMPGFLYGGHDRITCAMRNGTAVVTDGNPYIDMHYENLVRSFPATACGQLGSLFHELFEHPEQTKQMTAQAKAYADREHTWEGLTAGIMEDIEKNNMRGK